MARKSWNPFLDRVRYLEAHRFSWLSQEWSSCRLEHSWRCLQVAQDGNIQLWLWRRLCLRWPNSWRAGIKWFLTHQRFSWVLIESLGAYLSSQEQSNYPKSSWGLHFLRMYPILIQLWFHLHCIFQWEFLQQVDSRLSIQDGIYQII